LLVFFLGLFLEVLGTATFSVVLVFGTVGSVSKSDASSPVFSSTSVAISAAAITSAALSAEATTSAAASASLSSSDLNPATTQICRMAQKKEPF
jgi:hypothetical protein